jgi:hypothetical protein
MHGQQNDKYTEMHGQQNDKCTEMHGQQNIKKKSKVRSQARLTLNQTIQSARSDKFIIQFNIILPSTPFLTSSFFVITYI